MGNTWNTQLPKITNGVTTFSENDINPIITAIENNLSYLKSTLDGLNGQCGYIATLKGFSSLCKKGTLIALDGGLYVPASADWSSTYDNGGSLIPSSKATIVGVLLEDVHTDGSAAVLCDGWTTDPELIKILTESKGTGEYYLTTAGKADLKPPVMGVVTRCFTCVEGGFGSGNSCIIFKPQAPEYNGHTHNTYKLVGNWLNNLTKADVPHKLEDAVDKSKTASSLDIKGDIELSHLAELGSDQLILVKNGEILDNSIWCIEDSKIFIACNIIPSDNLLICGITPITGTSPIIRSIESDSEFIKIYNRGGNATLHINSVEDVISNPTGHAIAAIDASGVITTPVVNKIYPGVGISISSHKSDGLAIPGSYDIHATTTLGNQLDFNITNLDGVIFGTSEDMVSYLFPANIVSAMHGTVRVPSFEASDVRYRLNVLTSSSSSTDLSGSLKIYRWPGVSNMSDIAINFDTMSMTYSDVSKSLYIADFPNISAQANDFVVLTLKADSPYNNINVITTSLEMYINE